MRFRKAAVGGQPPHPDTRRLTAGLALFREDAKGRKGLGASPFGPAGLTTAPIPCASPNFPARRPARRALARVL